MKNQSSEDGLKGTWKAQGKELNFFYEALMQAPAFVAVLRGPNHIFEMANDNYVALIGREDFIGLPAAEVVPEAREQGFFDLLDTVYRSGKPFFGNEMPIKLKRKGIEELEELTLNFVYQPIRSTSGEVTGILAQGVDVTETVRLKKEAQANQEITQLALQASEAGLWTWDVLKNKIHWSARLEIMYGFEPGAFDGSFETYISSVHPEDREAIQKIVQNAIQTGEPYVTEHRVNHPDGKVVWIQGRGQAFYGTNKELVRMAGISFDITDRKAKDDLISRKSLELDRFAAIAAHDLTAPLNSITQFTELLASQYRGKLGDDADEYIDFIINAGNRMRALVGSLLGYARAGAVQSDAFTDVDLNAVIGNVRKNLFSLIGDSGARIVSERLPVVHGDEVQITQLFQNLISNAIKYSRIGITPQIQLTSKEGDNEWTFVIEDNGQGISAKHLPRIFDFFTRVGARDIDGSGIGLAICKKIVDVHNGQIWVESEVGSGSKFHFTIAKNKLTAH